MIAFLRHLLSPKKPDPREAHRRNADALRAELHRRQRERRDIAEARRKVFDQFADRSPYEDA